MKYFDLLIETEDAGVLMKQEIKSKTYQRDRCIRLRHECVKVYTNLFLKFNSDIATLADELTMEISKRDAKGQNLLYAQIFDLINEFADKFNNRNKSEGFSEESIGTKFSRINVETADGILEEKQIEYSFSIAMLADDLSIKYNQLQRIINKRFEFLNIKKSVIEISRVPSKLTCLLRLYYEKGCKPLNKQQVEKLADGTCFSKRKLVDKWIDLKRDGYRHTDNANNIKGFVEAYEALMEIFKDNTNAFNDVKNHYDQLKGTYPELTY